MEVSFISGTVATGSYGGENLGICLEFLVAIHATYCRGSLLRSLNLKP